MSSRAYKIHPLDVFSPHPTLHIDDSATSSPGANGLSRSNSRQTSFRTAQGWKFREPLTNKDANSGHRARVDDLADELDAKGLREAMERDQRRKDRKKREYEEKLQMKLEQRALDQLRFEAEPESDVGETYQNGENEQQYQRGESSRSAQQLDPETQTPLSWFNVDSSRENVDNEASEYAPRTGAVTPVSMDDSIEDDYEEAQRQSHLAEWVEKTVPAVMVESGSPPATTRAKTSAWTSFIKRATAARIKKDNASRGIPNRDSTGSEASVLRSQPNAGPYLDVEDLRHREGQTPGRHVAKEVVVAMNALASGHIQEKGYEDEMRDSVCPTPPIMIPYHLNGSQVSSRSSLNPQGPGLRGGATTKNSSPFDDTRDSPTIPQYHHPRPPSAQRYSPSMRYSSGGVSPEIGGARSIIAGSLASIDSEGSWLSGKVKPRQSMQHLSPLRTSASSLRKRYQDLDDNDVNMDDEYFSGVKSDKQVAGRDSRGGILDPDDSDDDDAVSINSETERNMWRKGMEQRVHMERGTKTMSRHGLLGILQTSDGDSPQLIDGDEYATPLEHPLERTISNNSDFKTPSEQQINYQVW